VKKTAKRLRSATRGNKRKPCSVADGRKQGGGVQYNRRWQMKNGKDPGRSRKAVWESWGKKKNWGVWGAGDVTAVHRSGGRW